MIRKIKTLVVPAVSTDEDLFPLTAVVPKELLPFGELPIIERIIENADFPEEVVFITSPEKKMIFEHFLKIKESSHGEKYASTSFSHILQKKSTGEANTISRAEKNMDGDPFMFSSSKSIFLSKIPLFTQLFNVFRTSEKPVLALSFDTEVCSSHVAEVEKIASRLYKIRKIMEKSEENKDMPTVLEKCIFTGASVDYLKNAKKEEGVMDSLINMLADGKTVYAYEADGQWASVHNYESYLKSNKWT